MTEKLPNALDMLKLEPTEFMAEVSRAVSPKPWTHDWCHVCALIMNDGTRSGPYDRCNRCSTVSRHGKDGECTVPPPITDHPAVVAETLLKRLDLCHRGLAFDNSIMWLKVGLIGDLSSAGLWAWFALDSTPQLKIACCLVALGLWQIDASEGVSHD